MKLFAKYNRINLLSTVTIFLIGCIAFSVLLRYVIINQIDSDLEIEKSEIVTYVNQHNSMPVIITVHDQYISYRNIVAPQFNGDKIYTIETFDSAENEKELRRTIEFNIRANDVFYFVTVSKSLEGTDDLIQTIIAITIGLILLILAATFLINRIVLRRLWKPFYQTLRETQQFNLNDTRPMIFDNTNIDEFNHLNAILSDALSKAQQDYKTLKEFTENASHELQTPVAVIQSKLDMIIQNEKLSEAESRHIQSAYMALKGLSKLNQSLLLLAKIDNNQFTENINIQLDDIIVAKQSQFAEQWESRSITVQSNITKATINGDQRLVDILLNNLFSNSIRHNTINGQVILQLQPNYFQITNTGNTQPLDELQIFSRFYKGNTENGQHGLGLSIVKQICDVSGYVCRYQFRYPNMHSFIISW